ncbi:uncharacterized protein Dmoj_GI25668 [Drosophila mojavensis]|uniref:Uncharacterized protein n=1 Tax=Drosophila mojavensis TaxID=7230 RepID=A0A0Q9X9Q6_DROMO|nr:uncharacterized protein Dmoj_GI25668 [Drosophila mojavensis]
MYKYVRNTIVLFIIITHSFLSSTLSVSVQTCKASATILYHLAPPLVKTISESICIHTVLQLNQL